MLRTPPQAMMNYYSNVFLSARFVLADQPDKLRYLDKEIRRVECMAGVFPSEDSIFVQDKLFELYSERQSLGMDINRLESMYDSADDDGKKEIEQSHQEITEKIKQINAKEHYLLYKLQPVMSLKMMETYMDNNMDLKSYFKENLQRVTQLELASELDKLKVWVYHEAVQLMPYIRFTKLE